MKKDKQLNSVANSVVLYQTITLSLFFTIILVFGFNIYVFYLLNLFIFIYSFYIVYNILVKENLCPQCGNSFFRKKDSFANIGFSIYTKKCTNCKYKLAKDIE